MNKVLIMFGESGIGKTSFARLLLNPVFKIMNIEVGEYIYQNPLVASNEIKIFVSPDDASPQQAYTFTQVIQGEVALQIKRENSPLNTLFKSGLVLTNICKKDFYNEEAIGKSFGSERLRRRTMFSEIGPDRDFVKYIFGDPVKCSPPPMEFKCFHFWHTLLKLKGSKKLKEYTKTIDIVEKINAKDYQKKYLKGFKKAL